MSTKSPRIEISNTSAKIAIIASLWNEEIVAQLIAGAEDTLSLASVEYETFRVSGAFELPLLCSRALERFDAAIALGVVIRGDTPHFDYINKAVTDGINRVILDSKKPIGFGVLMVEDDRQALERVQPNNNKGKESAEAVLLSLEQLRKVEGQL